jgi:hypothetical protein
LSLVSMLVVAGVVLMFVILIIRYYLLYRKGLGR